MWSVLKTSGNDAYFRMSFYGFRFQAVDGSACMVTVVSMNPVEHWASRFQVRCNLSMVIRNLVSRTYNSKMLRHGVNRFNDRWKLISQMFQFFLLYSTAINVFLTQETFQPPTLPQHGSRTFRVKRATDGTEFCASDNPSAAYNSSQLDKPVVGSRCVPWSLLCAWKCSTDESCISFNWKNDQQLCEIFYYVPVSCEFVAGCNFHEVGKLFNGLLSEHVATCILFAKEWTLRLLNSLLPIH